MKRVHHTKIVDTQTFEREQCECVTDGVLTLPKFWDVFKLCVKEVFVTPCGSQEPVRLDKITFKSSADSPWEIPFIGGSKLNTVAMSYCELLKGVRSFLPDKNLCKELVANGIPRAQFINFSWIPAYDGLLVIHGDFKPSEKYTVRTDAYNMRDVIQVISDNGTIVYTYPLRWDYVG